MRFLRRLLTAVGLRRRQVNILMVGLDNSGKTSIINALKSSHSPSTAVDASDIVPTVGFSVDSTRFGSLNLTVFDMSGHGRYRDLWQHYYADVQGIVFVFDMSDASRLAVVKEELMLMLQHELVSSSRMPLLLLANKIDLPAEQLMDLAQVTDVLGLDVIKDHNWHICPCSALAGVGIEPGFDWLADTTLKLPYGWRAVDCLLLMHAASEFADDFDRWSKVAQVLQAHPLGPPPNSSPATADQCRAAFEMLLDSVTTTTKASKRSRQADVFVRVTRLLTFMRLKELDEALETSRKVFAANVETVMQTCINSAQPARPLEPRHFIHTDQPAELAATRLDKRDPRKARSSRIAVRAMEQQQEESTATALAATPLPKSEEKREHWRSKERRSHASAPSPAGQPEPARHHKRPRLEEDHYLDEYTQLPEPSVDLSHKHIRKMLKAKWEDISNLRLGNAFLNPLRKMTTTPDYASVIFSPTDLKLIKQRVHSGEITSVDQFHRELLLMLANTVMYNKEGSETHLMAIEMKTEIERHMSSLRQQQTAAAMLQERQSI
ncbi:ADP-ribosylation factor-like protein 6 [Sorochytrium milnesiophthora]